MKPSFLLHSEHREKIRNKCEDQVPYESPENSIPREVRAQEGKESSIETESSVGVEVHNERIG